MPVHRTPATVRAAVGAALLTTVLGGGVASAADSAPVDPAPAVATHGVPLERLPDGASGVAPGSAPGGTGGGATGSATGSAPERHEPVAPPGAVLLGAGAGALLLLVLRQRRLAAEPGPAGVPGVPDLLTGTPALVHALSTALAQDGEPVGLVLLRVETAPAAGTATRAHEWEAADAVLEALDVAVPLVAEQVGRRARAGDGVVRLGMNRLAVVLPGGGAAEARAVGERLRAALTAAAAPGLAVAVGSAGSPPPRHGPVGADEGGRAVPARGDGADRALSAAGGRTGADHPRPTWSRAR